MGESVLCYALIHSLLALSLKANLVALAALITVIGIEIMTAF